MIVASLFALALLQDAPLASAPPPSPPSDAVSTSAPPPSDAAPVSTASAPVESDIPKGAPGDDFGLVAWCRGALTGHMALYQIVKPELKGLERPSEVATEEKDDQAQMQAGRDYLALYRRAMLTAENESRTPIRPRGAALIAQGEAIWAGAREAEPRKRMWTWLMWDLPGRCEIAAKRLEAHKGGGAPAPAADAPTPGSSTGDALSPPSPAPQ